MTQSNLQQAQLDRIVAIARADLTDLKVGRFPPASIDSRLPLLLPMLSPPVTAKRRAATLYDITTTWNLYLYLQQVGADSESANQSHLYALMDGFFNAFLSRNQLQLSGSKLAYCRDTEFEMVSGIDTPQRYPPRSGQALYWGCQYRLTVYSTNYTVQVT